MYNLALTRRGISIIESDFDWKEYMGYFTLGHSIFFFFFPSLLAIRITEIL
jgi:hypothetical protein